MQFSCYNNRLSIKIESVVIFGSDSLFNLFTATETKRIRYFIILLCKTADCEVVLKKKNTSISTNIVT